MQTYVEYHIASNGVKVAVERSFVFRGPMMDKKVIGGIVDYVAGRGEKYARIYG